MACKIFVRPEAERDLASSYAFYQECRCGSGRWIPEQCRRILRTHLENPFLNPDIHRGIRRALLRRFPYDPAVAQALKQVAEHGRSAEAEHREIRRAALARPARRRLKDVLAAMPDVGTDEDFNFRQG